MTDRILNIAQAVLLAVALIAGLLFISHRTHQNQAEIKGQVDRIEGDVKAMRSAIDDQYRYIRQRDAKWASELGWPAPPALEADESR